MSLSGSGRHIWNPMTADRGGGDDDFWIELTLSFSSLFGTILSFSLKIVTYGQIMKF